jgi:two-component system, cell cycle sensor histidine kinase and response regulator CckA
MGKTPKPPHSRDDKPKKHAREAPASNTEPVPTPKPRTISADSARQLWEFVQNATDMLYIQDMTGGFTWVNAAATRIMGYSYEEATRLNMVDIVAPEHWDIAREKVQRKLQGELSSSQYEITLIAKDGRRIPAEVSTQLFFDNGIPYVHGIARDISDRKKAEQDALIQKTYLEELFENAPEAILVLDTEDRVQRVNREFSAMFGYSSQEAAGKFIHELIVPAEHQEESRFFSEATSHGGRINRETRRKRKDGTLVDVSILGTPIRFSGKQLGVYAIYRDISSRKQAEEAVRRSEQHYRTVIQNATDIICILDGHGTVRFASPSMSRLLGYRSEELIGRSGFPLIHPDDLEVAQQNFARAWGGAELDALEIRLRHKDGQYVRFEAAANRPNDDRLIGEMVVSLRDVTERLAAQSALRESEARYRLLFERNLAGVFRSTVDGQILDCNDAFARMYGYESSEQVMKHSATEFYPDPAVRAAFIERLRKAGGLLDCESQGKKRDGSEIWVLENVSLVPGQNGERDLMQGTMVDITARKLAEQVLVNNDEQLRRHNKTLVELSKRKSITLGDLQAALKDITEAAANTVETARAGIWFYNRERNGVRCVDLFDRRTAEHSAGVELPSIPDSPYVRALEEHRTIAADDVKTDPRTADFLDDYLRPHGVVSTLDAPVRIAGNLVGVICHEHCGAPRNWTVEEENFAASMADLVALAVEASERQQSQRALAESEYKFRAVAETAASAIYIHDGKRFLYVNRASEIISGYSREELLGMDPFALAHPDSREELKRRTVARLQGTDLSPSVECKIVSKEGKSLWVELSATSIQFEGRQAVLATLFDITERKKAEKLQAALYRIAEESSRARNLDDLYPVLHGIVSELMYAKNFYIALYDSRDETVRFPYFVDEQDEAPVGSAPVGKGLTEYVLRTGNPLLFSPESPDARKELGVFQPIGPASVDWLGVPLKKEGVAFGVLTVQSYTEKVRFTHAEVEILNFVSQQVANALERKRAEDALRESELRNRSLVQSAVYGIYRSSVEDRFLDVNPALVTMLGYDRAEEVLQLSIAKDVYVEAEERARLVQQYQNSEAISGVEVRWKRRDGKPIIVRLSGRALSDSEGKTILFEMIAEDVTERRALEEQLRQSQKMEAVGRLAGGVAHDFNNLLTVIRGYSELILSQLEPGEPLQAEVEEVRKAADRAALLTQQLLAFSRKQVLAPKVLDLNAVVTNMDRLMRRLLGEDVNLVTKLDGSLGRTKADPGQIEQVIMNLAVNARDAMPEGGSVTIETLNVVLDEFISRDFAVTPGDYVLLCFSDTGHGMNAEVRARVFEPFFTTKEQGKGTGLGLSTVYGIVKQSGGYIWVYSEPGQGTTFKVYLPMAAEQAEKRGSDISPSALRRGSETILLVEDEDGVRTLIKQLLHRQGYIVIETRHGGEAMEECERYQSPIHLLLTDVVLTQMNGRELAQKLLPIRPEMKVLFMSGYSEEAIAQHGVLNPGTEFLQKPFTTEALIRKVREVLDAPQHAVAAGN